MSCIQLLLLTALPMLSAAGLLGGGGVPDDPMPVAPGDGAPTGRLFVAESEASEFFSRRSRRSTWFHELLVEQRLTRVASRRRQELLEEKHARVQSYSRELSQESGERSRETGEQLREFHYDGLHPRNLWFH